MSGALVNIKVEDKEVKDLFARMKERGKDLLPAMKVSGQIVRTSVVKNFEEGAGLKSGSLCRLRPFSPGKRGSSRARGAGSERASRSGLRTVSSL